MKHVEQAFCSGLRRGLFAALLLALVAGCGDQGGGTATGPGATPATDPDAALLQEVEDVEVPSEEEAAQRAEENIDEANADAEFEKLKQEIEGGG